MARIRSVIPLPERPEQRVVETDDEQSYVLDARALERLGLAEGDDASRLACLGKLDDATQKTWTRALNILSYHDRSVSQLGERLRDKGEEPPQIAVVLDRLLALGYLDDERLATRHASSAMAGRARSPRRVKDSLRRKGIAPATAERAVQSALDEHGTQERELALRAAQKKAPSLRRFDERAQRQKLYGYLSRQGFASEAVRYAVERTMRGGDDDEP